MPFIPVIRLADEAPTLEEAAANAPPRESLSGTSLSLDIPRAPVIPFAKSNDIWGAQEKPNLSDKPIFTPKLPLEHHAAMTVEIATYPAPAMAILQRYGLGPPEKVDLDRYYQRLVASDPGKKAAWHAAHGARYTRIMQSSWR